jgi:hypothetical protein
MVVATRPALAEAKAAPEGLFKHAELANSYSDGRLDNGGYASQDRQPLASHTDADGTRWQVVAYISLHRLPVVQWRKKEAESDSWSLWARIGQDDAVLPATGPNWHGYASTVIDKSGFVHLLYDGRGAYGGAFRYYRSDHAIDDGWTGGWQNLSDSGLPDWDAGTKSTYWRFTKDRSSGALTLSIRRSGKGHSLFTYSTTTRQWTAHPGTDPATGRIFTNDGLFAHYVSHDIVVRGGDVYVGYTERKKFSSNTVSNEDLSLIKYNGATGQWQDLAGTILTTPVGQGEGTIIDNAKTGAMLDQRWDLMLDADGTIHGFYRRLDAFDHLQLFHFWIDEEDTVHGPSAVTDSTYTGFWRDAAKAGSANLSNAHSFHIGNRIYVAWQEADFGNRTVVSASMAPFAEWSQPVVIDETPLLSSDPEFERWALETRGEVWLAAMPFAPNSGPDGRAVTVVRIKDLPLLPGGSLTFGEWIADSGVPEGRREPNDRNGPLALPNLLAYAMGIHPMTGTAADMLRVTPRHSADGTVRLRMEYTRNTRTVKVDLATEGSLDLQEWSHLEAISETVVKEMDGVERVHAEFAAPAGERLFLRVAAHGEGSEL